MEQLSDVILIAVAEQACGRSILWVGLYWNSQLHYEQTIVMRFSL